MPEPGKPPDLRVQCANCKLQVDVNRYLVLPPEEPLADKLHLAAFAEGGFVGSVHCPNCGYFTTYAPKAS